MKQEVKLKPIARIRTPFADKFGIPRQGILAAKSEALIVFEPDFRKDGILLGIEDFSHLWLLWGFSEQDPDGWSAVVRPPKLGGSKKAGVFASRSPRRPNPIGLTAVRLLESVNDPQLGPVLRVSGADMVNGTPIYDIKPYLPYCDCFPDARSGYAKDGTHPLPVEFQNNTGSVLSPSETEALAEVLSADPRPGYQSDPDRCYHIRYGGYDIAFFVRDGVVQVTEVNEDFH